MSARQRTRLRGRIVLALTANHHYAIDRITAGARIARVRRRLTQAERRRIGGNTWYGLRSRHTTRVLEVQHGTVVELGIANYALTATRAQQRLLLTGF